MFRRFFFFKKVNDQWSVFVRNRITFALVEEGEENAEGVSGKSLRGRRREKITSIDLPKSLSLSLSLSHTELAIVSAPQLFLHPLFSLAFCPFFFSLTFWFVKSQNSTSFCPLKRYKHLSCRKVELLPTKVSFRNVSFPPLLYFLLSLPFSSSFRSFRKLCNKKISKQAGKHCVEASLNEWSHVLNDLQVKRFCDWIRTLKHYWDIRWSNNTKRIQW